MIAGGAGRAAARSLLLATAVCAGLAAAAAAQDSPAQWLARIFDPATVGLAPFPGSVLNRKLSVDAIVLERGGDKRIAMYIIEKDRLQAAADHFAKQFGVPPRITGADSPFVTYTFDFTAPPAPGTQEPGAKLTGLRVQVSRSQFVDGKGQITMDYSPPATPPTPAS